MSDDPDKSLDEKLASVERSPKQVNGALGLLGLQPCSRCGVFYRRSDKGVLFHYDEFVCFKCVPLGGYIDVLISLPATGKRPRVNYASGW